MSDLIDRQAAIDAIKEFKRGVEEWKDEQEERSDIWHRADSAIASALEIGLRIKKLPSAQPEPQWIPCSERLPENDNEVLITVWDAEDDYVEVYKGFYQDHEWWTQWCHGCLKIKDEPCGENIVIAWMPLPEPYKG